jgi:hypothetical protein
LTLHEAVRMGISKLRTSNWACAEDHILLDIITQDGHNYHGPLVHLYSPLNEVIGQPNPQDLLFLMFDWDEDGWEPYNS